MSDVKFTIEGFQISRFTLLGYFLFLQEAFVIILYLYICVYLEYVYLNFLFTFSRVRMNIYKKLINKGKINH